MEHIQGKEGSAAWKKSRQKGYPGVKLEERVFVA